MHARTLLINVPVPAELVAEMARLARPGGWVTSMEPDTEYTMCYPPHPAFARICEIFPVVFGRNGAGHTISRRVPELFRQVGLQDDCHRHDEDQLAGPTMSWTNRVASASSPDKV